MLIAAQLRNGNLLILSKYISQSICFTRKGFDSVKLLNLIRATYLNEVCVSGSTLETSPDLVVPQKERI